MDLVDKQHVALFEVGQQRRQIPRLGDHRTRGRPKPDPQFPCHDLRQRGFAKARRPNKQHVVERRAPALGRFDEDLEIGPRGGLSDELGKAGRPKRDIERLVAAGGSRGEITWHAKSVA